MSSSEPEMSFVPPSSLEETIRTRHPNLSPFLPFLLGVAVPAPSQDLQEPGEIGTVRGRIVLINPSSELVIVIEGSGNLESLLRDLSNKDGPLPASKASIEAMPAVKITEEGSNVRYVWGSMKSVERRRKCLVSTGIIRVVSRSGCGSTGRARFAGTRCLWRKMRTGREVMETRKEGGGVGLGVEIGSVCFF